MHENGPGSSPILWRDRLIVHCDGSDHQYIVALNKQTGELAWKTDRSGTMRDNGHLKKAYGTPHIVDVAGRPQIMSPAADWLYAYEPATGRELWKLNYGAMGFSIVPRPLVGHGLLFMSTSFMRPELLAIRYEEILGQNAPSIAWRYSRGVPQVPNPILIGNELYFISDAGGMVTCLEARTGTELWKDRVGGNHCAAPLAGDGKLYFCSREGVTAVLVPGTTFRVLAKNTLPGRIMASPAAADESLVIRTDTALYRIGAGKP
jgi:outer membrane protein assembly factor BamB